MSILNNQTGAEGNEFRYVAKNSTWIIGGGCTNVAPATRINRYGEAIPKTVPSRTSGFVPIMGALPKATPIDTAITHPHGSLSICVGNIWNSTIGSGGVSINTSGPYRIHANYGIIASDTDMNIESGSVVRIKSGTAIVFDAPKVFTNVEGEMCMNNTIQANGNIVANGGLYVRGETFITHMNTQAQIMQTEESSDINGFINPIQSFAVVAGNSTLANTNLLTMYSGLLSAISGELEKNPLFIEAIVSLPFPKPIDQVINVPIKIAFPYGIRLISDGLYGIAPGEAQTLFMTRPNKGVGIKEADVSSMGGHTHLFIGPSATYHKDTTALYTAAADSGVTGNQAINHEAISHGGMEDWIKSYIENQKKKPAQMIEKNVKGWISRMFGIS